MDTGDEIVSISSSAYSFIFAHGEGENMKDYVNSLESIVRKIWNNINSFKLKLSEVDNIIFSTY